MDEMSEMKKHAEETQDISHDANSEKGKYMTFKSGNEYFGLGIQYVNEIIQIQEITAIPETENYIKGLINLRGKVIPVIDVRLRFKQEAFEYNDRTCIIVINVKSTIVGLIVEKIAEVVEIKRKIFFRLRKSDIRIKCKISMFMASVKSEIPSNCC